MEIFDILKKMGSVAFDATLGLAKAYHEKTVQLVKLEAATFYINSVKALRKHFLLMLGMIFCVCVLACSVVLAPILLVLLSPLGYGAKFSIVAGLCVVYVGVPLFVLSRLSSEKTWMDISKSNELMDRLTNGHS